MQPSPMPSARALARLRQLAREESIAVDTCDVDGLCRAVALLPSAMQDYADSAPTLDDAARQAIAEILQAHDRARGFLEMRLDALSVRLCHLAAAKRLRQSKAAPVQPRVGVLNRVG
jgi:hypothetical protein